MRTLLVASMLLLAGVTLVSAAPAASACIPPNCPGWMTCTWRDDEIRVDPATLTVTGPGIDCYY